MVDWGDPPSKNETGPRGSGPVFVWEEVRL
jgi:hypothetical protein